MKKVWWIFIPAIVILLFMFFFIQTQQSLKNIKSSKLTKDEAISKVKALPEVIDYLKRVSNGLVLVNGEEANTYMVQVYEFKNGHTATFNWYRVNKKTGEIKKEF